MTPDERQMLADLFERIRATGATPRDAQAEAFINDAVRAVPFAPYALAQTVLIQNQALERAAHRISELEAAAQGQGQAEPPTSFLGGLGKTLFGGGGSAAQPRSSYDAGAYQRTQPQAPPAYAPPQGGPWGAPAAGGGFLHNAISTAAGVAGGLALGNIIGGLFGGHGGGLFGGGFPGGGETINNYYGTGPGGQGANLSEMDALQDQQQDALDGADAQQDALQDAGDNSGGDFSGGDGGGFDV